MNDLSTLLYIADVLPKLGKLFSFLIIVSLMWLIPQGLYCLVEEKPFPRPILSMCVVFSVVMGAILIPSQKTILLMASSEYSEEVVNSEFGQEILTESKDALLRTLKSVSQGQGE